MLNLDQPDQYPQFRVKYKDQEHEFDPLLWGEELESIDTTIDNATQILTIIKKLTGFETISSLQAFAVVADFYRFIKEEFDDAVKNVLGRSLFLDTTTELEESNIENSDKTPSEEPNSTG